MKKDIPVILLITLLYLLSACTPTPSAVPSPVDATALPLSGTPSAGAGPVATLSPEPQDISFQTPQGRTLQGRYFPASVENAPLVVFTHWIMANQDDWQAVALWLQNRGGTALVGSCSSPSPCPWWESSWFPPVGDRSYAVFTCNLSGCDAANGCSARNPLDWLEDANAAILYASQLQGVDSSRIVTAGASIGADAAIDSCAWLDSQGGAARCVGTLAFSPGGYLTLPYSGQVAALGALQPAVPTWCLFAEGDLESAIACRPVSGGNYRPFEYAGSAHGMMLIQPTLAPKDSSKTTLELFLDFLDQALGR